MKNGPNERHNSQWGIGQAGQASRIAYKMEVCPPVESLSNCLSYSSATCLQGSAARFSNVFALEEGWPNPTEATANMDRDVSIRPRPPILKTRRAAQVLLCLDNVEK